ncbi:MAG: SRPBCC family protein [Gordonia sp. (in: high G+C Gram-positive bacteria)]|uniref:SRPBCC family protein n=1 Tax=Gordonia sp. (in: high G+C Gram-positive bacteria) TaxID=84139 RepID=UPI0039E22E1D
MGHVNHENTVNAPIAKVWDYMSNVENLTEWMFGLSEMKPLTEQTRGEGARFDSVMKLGAKLQSVIEIVRWVDGEEIDTDSVSGFDNQTRWKLTEIDPNTTKISVQIDYKFPGGLAGKAMSKLVEPAVHAAVSASDHKLNSILEKL